MITLTTSGKLSIQFAPEFWAVYVSRVFALGPGTNYIKKQKQFKSLKRIKKKTRLKYKIKFCMDGAEAHLNNISFFFFEIKKELHVGYKS